MPTVTFVSGATTLTFAKGITLPLDKGAEKAQVVGETDGGQTYVYTKGSTILWRKVILPGLSQAQWDALYTFWDSTVNGKATAFTFNDELGNAYATARIWSDKLEWVERGWHPAPWYTVELLLRIG